MLVLSRKIGEQIVIGDGIVVVIKRITGQRVTLGIEAPSDVHIMRGELEPVSRTQSAPAPLGIPASGSEWTASLASAKPR